MNKWYLITCKFTKEFTDGTLKRVSQKYIVNAYSFTDAEAKITAEVGAHIRGAFEIKKIQQKRYEDLYLTESQPFGTYYECKVDAVISDADTGKDKKSTFKFIVEADNLGAAFEFMRQDLDERGVKATISAVVDAEIEEVFISNGFQTSVTDKEAAESV